MEAVLDRYQNVQTRIFAVDFEPAALSALPRHIRLPGAVIVTHSIDSLRALDMTGDGAPSLVISPLVTGIFDAQDLASLLAEMGYRGRYVAVANDIAKPSVIRTDVALVAPSLHFEVVALDGKAPLRLV